MRLAPHLLFKGFRQKLRHGTLESEGMVEITVRSDLIGKPRHDQIVSAVKMVLDRVGPGGFDVIGTEEFEEQAETSQAKQSSPAAETTPPTVKTGPQLSSRTPVSSQPSSRSRSQRRTLAEEAANAG